MGINEEIGIIIIANANENLAGEKKAMGQTLSGRAQLFGLDTAEFFGARALLGVDDKALLATGLEEKNKNGDYKIPDKQLGDSALETLRQKTGLPAEVMEFLNRNTSEQVGDAVRESVLKYAKGGTPAEVGEVFMSNLIAKSPEMAVNLGKDALAQVDAHGGLAHVLGSAPAAILANLKPLQLGDMAHGVVQTITPIVETIASNMSKGGRE